MYTCPFLASDLARKLIPGSNCDKLKLEKLVLFVCGYINQFRAKLSAQNLVEGVAEIFLNILIGYTLLGDEYFFT